MKRSPMTIPHSYRGGDHKGLHHPGGAGDIIPVQGVKDRVGDGHAGNQGHDGRDDDGIQVPYNRKKLQKSACEQ